MKITDYLAIWGAVVASIVAAWNIYKDFLKRHHLKVHSPLQKYVAVLIKCGLEGIFVLCLPKYYPAAAFPYIF